jgi:uncharacterized membrane protein YsdA (DUF1294 family)
MSGTHRPDTPATWREFLTKYGYNGGVAIYMTATAICFSVASGALYVIWRRSANLTPGIDEHLLGLIAVMFGVLGIATSLMAFALYWIARNDAGESLMALPLRRPWAWMFLLLTFVGAPCYFISFMRLRRSSRR